MNNKRKTIRFSCQTCSSRIHSVFQKIHGEELEFLDVIKACQFLKKNQTVYTEGSHSNGLYCFNDGKAKIYKLGEDGKKHIVGFVKSGDTIGFRDLLAGEPYSASVDVIEDSTICFIPRRSLLTLMEKNPSLCMKFMDSLCTQLKTTQERVIDMSHKSVRQRLAQALLLLKETFGFEEDKKTLSIQLSRKDLAHYIGTAPETIIRMLYEFQDQNMIQLDGQKILFKNTDALIEITGIYT